VDDFPGRVAVITGAASGIGRGLASVFARAGMKLVLADVEEPALRAAEAELRAGGADVLALRTDVSDGAAVEALAEAAYARHGRVHVLCNNAGVGGATSNLPGIWNVPEQSWRWVLGVNLMGVVHGLQSFVPRMLDAGEEGHIVNTSSVMGVWSGHGAVYNVSKHAVTSLSEGLWSDLRSFGAPIGVTVLLPGLVASRINTAARNWQDPLKVELRPEIARHLEEMEASYLRDGMSPERVGEITLSAIRERCFYAFTHPGSEQRVLDRMNAIVEHRDPPLPRSPRPRNDDD
jgi:NAD(P)-dependent dehydrogenase (short-subunit alcohol dehydrogenase family)